jgi:N-methylhydantoinase B
MTDLITVQILRNKIASLVDEMHYHFYRSGYSTIIRESRDFSCVILDRVGRLVSAPPMFFHAPVYRHLIGRVLEDYTGRIADGDVFVSNHPYAGGLPHVSDMAFAAPIFAGGKIAGFAGSIAHKADVGGAVPGSTSANATEMFQEGILIPPVKIKRAGTFDTDIQRIVLTNSREPELVRGDMRAQIAVTEMGVGRVKELYARFGAETVTDAFQAILDGAADALRAALRRLPEGSASAEGFLDSDGVDFDKPIKLAVTVTIADGIATFDFTQSAPQARGPINLRPSMIEACVFYSLLGALDPSLQFNDGMRDAVRLKLAPRTVTNAEPPASVSNYQMVNLKLVDVILEALAPFTPGRAIAHAGSSSALSIIWAQGRGIQYEIIGSAYGGGAGHDGVTGTATHLSNLHITPIEILESEYPCRVTRFDLVPDSGGAGHSRGGLGMVREYELLEDATVIRRFDKAKYPPCGLAGGRPGAGACFVVNGETKPPGRYELRAGDGFLLQTAGGGGYGAPAERDRGAVRRDVAEGYVTRAGAAKDYGLEE